MLVEAVFRERLATKILMPARTWDGEASCPISLRYSLVMLTLATCSSSPRSSRTRATMSAMLSADVSTSRMIKARLASQARLSSEVLTSTESKAQGRSLRPYLASCTCSSRWNLSMWVFWLTFESFQSIFCIWGGLLSSLLLFIVAHKARAKGIHK
jgi:hypothetical protein